MLTPAPAERLGSRVALRRLLIVAVMAAALLCLGAAPALAAPANDNFAAATPATVPFSDSVEATDATTEVGEPQFCGPVDKSIWYAVTPTADAILSADTTGSGTPSQLNVYRQDGTGFGGLSFLSCASSYEPAIFHVQAGITYYLQGSPMFFLGGQLSVHIKEVTAPANDNFADATAFSSVPYSDHPLLTAASMEPAEPTACVGSSQRTVWYAFTPAETNSYVIDRSNGFEPLAVYTGRSLGSLQQVACAGYSTPIFRGEAGTTYYLQLADGGPFSGASVDLSVAVAPPATASFFYYPSDPSSLDTVQFYDASYDIGHIASRLWGFGDGATTSDCCPSHRYGADGDYDAKLAITTGDGRSASTARPISVKTHDVSIVRMSVPNSARVGQSRQLSIDIANNRYAETAEVALLRSVPGGGFEPVGQITNSVPVRSHGRTTTFAISYTFAPQDATLGKVTFQAVATIVGARDANPADNAIIALPTKVTR
jgi:PKD repeat protein